jgi:hypothetical protein
MGGNPSKAAATNVMRVMNSTNVSSTQNCYNSQYTLAGPSNFTLSNFDCKEGISVNNLDATAQSTCDQNVDITVLVKNVLDQTASAEAKTGVALQVFSAATADASTIVDLQNNIAAQIYASCSNSQQTVVQERNFVIDGLRSDGYCKIGDIGVSAQMACTNRAIIDLTTDNNIKQSAEATATSGFDLGVLLAILLVIFGGGLVISLFGIVMKLVLTGGKKKTGPADLPLSSLAAKYAALKAKVAARAAKLARQAVKDSMTPPTIAVSAPVAAPVSSSPLASARSFS